MILGNPKLLALDKAVAQREKLGAMGKKIILTNGVFDLLHAGHIYFLREARDRGDALFVALNSSESVKILKGPSRPIVDVLERAYCLSSLVCVDAIVVFNTPRLDAEIRALRPDVYCKAGDYTLDKLDPGERTALTAVGARVEFLPFLPGFSTTNLIARIKAAGEI
jgi:D-glycero-beta-D-manno-heptose 1-phosphate adenylyltransferase